MKRRIFFQHPESAYRLFFILILLNFLRADFIETIPVGPGILHHHEYREAGPWHIHVLEIDRTDSLNQIETVKANDALYGNERTSSMAARKDAEAHRVVGAVNADFYAAGGITIGAQVLNGILLKRPYPRSVFGTTGDGFPFIDIVSFTGSLRAADDSTITIQGVNEARDENQLIAYNHYFGSATGTNYWGTEVTVEYLTPQPAVNEPVQVVVVAKDSVHAAGHGNNTIPADGLVLSGHGLARDFLNAHAFVGDTLVCQMNLPPSEDPVLELVGGVPRLIRNGVATVEWNQEGVNYDFAHNRHPRTAVGYSADSARILLFTVDGRQPGYSVGMNLFELADYMLEWNVYQGMNLDGGGSTTMVVRGAVANSPSDAGGERAVANALMVVSTAPTGPLANLRLDPRSAAVVVGSSLQFAVAGFDQYFNPVAVVPDSLIWSCDSTIGSVAEGLFTAGSELAEGYLFVEINSVRDSALVQVTDIATITLEPNPIVLQVGEQQIVSPTATDTYGNLINLNPADYTWAVSGDIGTVSATGTFTAAAIGTGYVTASFHAVTGSAAVTVGNAAEVVLDDFTTVANWNLTGTNVNLAGCGLEASTEQSLSPPASGKLIYSLVTGGTSALYMNGSIPVSGSPSSVAISIYGDGQGHWLRGEFEDADGEKFLINFTEAAPGINWTNTWQTREIPFTAAIAHWGNPAAILNFPITWKKIYLVETDDANKNSGQIFLEDFKVEYTTLGTSGSIIPVPGRFNLFQNYPNPLNPSTTIQYYLPSTARVELAVSDIRGKTLETLVTGDQPEGEYRFRWDAARYASGVYFYTLRAGDFRQTRKMIVMK